MKAAPGAGTSTSEALLVARPLIRQSGPRPDLRPARSPRYRLKLVEALGAPFSHTSVCVSWKSRGLAEAAGGETSLGRYVGPPWQKVWSAGKGASTMGLSASPTASVAGSIMVRASTVQPPLEAIFDASVTGWLQLGTSPVELTRATIIW